MKENRCFWASGDDFYIRYHDEEWGVPVHDDRLLFEFLILEGFQAGLSWYCILKKRENFWKAFDGFDPKKVAKYGDKKIETLMQDAGIIRNRLKINAAVTNAKAFLAVQKEFGTFDRYIWGFVKGKPIQNAWKTGKELPAKTELAEKISKDLKLRGFKFVGPTVIYAHMQATGMVNDHLTSCFRWKECNAISSPALEDGMRADMIAPCGMNCGFCSAYLAMSRGHEKKKGMQHCTGCRARNKDCSFIKKRCPSGLRKNIIRFCYECDKFPCENLEKVAKRYVTTYNYDFIEALKFIRDKGMPAFLKREKKKWKCPNCGDIICVHNGKCYKCQEIKSWRG